MWLCVTLLYSGSLKNCNILLHARVKQLGAYQLLDKAVLPLSWSHELAWCELQGLNSLGVEPSTNPILLRLLFILIVHNGHVAYV